MAPLGDVQEPTAPFREISIEVTGTYILTPRGNKYLLSFIKYFTKYAKAFEIAIRLPKLGDGLRNKNCLTIRQGE